MPDSAGREVLAQGPIAGWSYRRRVLVAVVAAIVVLGAFAADRRSRAAETEALAACTHQVETSIVATSSPVFAMANYIRPVREGAPVALQRDLDRFVMRPAARAAAGLATAFDACRFEVWPLHPAVVDRREGCVAVLDRAVAYIGAVSRVGGAVFDPDLELELRC